ncbi:MAG: oligoribonuclease [Candidatus Omnitrophica bacterium]|nr:oligoribonuclease [Candidatus Omnitrophota bacterium]
MKKQNKQNLVWMDLEMTGLDPEKESIIEIATIITDGELNILAQGPSFAIKQPERLLKKMDDWNQKQHARSGLLDLVRQSKVTLAKAERETLKFIKEYCLEGKSPLCGNSIHHDRRFLLRHMPKLSAYLHYRIIDVSSLKGLVDRWYPKHKDRPPKNDDHRALGDVLNSIEELRFYRKTYFKSH